MADTGHREPSLAALAFLYAGGYLPGDRAAAFEERLGADQDARDALCQAVRLRQALDGRSAPAPGPAYREEVRRRLRAGRGLWQKFFGRAQLPAR